MAHKTLINGTSYEITGGRAMVDGTGYEIKSGKTLVGGTAYEVGFAPPVVKLTVISTDGATPWWRLDTEYNREDTGTFEITPSQTLVVRVRAAWITSTSFKQAKIYLNGTQVGQSGANPGSSTTGSYTIDLTGLTEVTLEFTPINGYTTSAQDDNRACQHCYITTT